MNRKLAVCIGAIAALSGCTTEPTHVIASTATVIGVDLGQGQATQAVQGTLGYKRAEFAIVPTNKPKPAGGGASADGGGANVGNGASDTANVIMELNYSGIFSSGGGIYQRLAVGNVAVTQGPAAQLLFAKGKSGAIDPQAAEIARTIAEEGAVEKNRIAAITKCFDNGSGAVDGTKLDAALNKASASNPTVFSNQNKAVLKRRASTSELAEFLGDPGDRMVPDLYAALPDACR